MPTSVEISVAKQNALDAAIAADNSPLAKLLELYGQITNKRQYIDKPDSNAKVRITTPIKQAKLAADADTYWKKHSGLGLIGANFGFDTNTSNFGLAVIKRDATGAIKPRCALAAGRAVWRWQCCDAAHACQLAIPTCKLQVWLVEWHFGIWQIKSILCCETVCVYVNAHVPIKPRNYESRIKNEVTQKLHTQKLRL